MSVSRSFPIFSLCVAVAFAAHLERASAESDRVLITSPGGDVLLDVTLPGPPPYPYQTAFHSTVPYPPGAPRAAVILTRPPGEPYGDDPVFVPGTSLVASDIVIFNSWFFPPDTGVYELFYFDDEDPSFEFNVSIDASIATLVEKTGSLQDLTNLLGSPWRVQVQSEVVPEPATASLVLAGLVALAYRKRSAAARGCWMRSSPPRRL